MSSNVFPVEIWHLIFSLACIDDGSTGRSLSLVSTHFHEISAPFKYQSIAITDWSQIIAFSQFFCKLPASQKKIVSLFVHHPYPFLDVNGPTHQSSEQSQSEDDLESSEDSEDIQEICDESALPDYNNGDGVFNVMDVEGLFADDWSSDVESVPGSEDSWSCSDGVWDSEFEGSFDDEEEREILEDVEYLEAVGDGRLPHDGNTRDDILRDADIQAFFDNVLQAFHAVLHEISSTLQILAVYWTSFKPLQIHKLLPPLPCLVELHINRSSIVSGDIYENPPDTVLFPELLSLYISGDNPRKLSFSDELARIAPNLAFLRFSKSHFSYRDPEDPKHDFYFHQGGIIIESNNCQGYKYLAAEKQLKREFGRFKYEVKFYLVDDVYKSDSPEIWQKWWTNQIVGNKYNGPWTILGPRETIGKANEACYQSGREFWEIWKKGGSHHITLSKYGRKSFFKI